ncbi:MAG TPA: hypothetical protein ENJ95_09490 [Bacteroidetes bacterium]|nr:hypothetical protein [Bacteroidota bacterium]
MRNTLFFFALAFFLAFAACTSETKDNDQPDWKHNDNTVRVRLSADVTSLNPFLVRGSWDRTAYELLFQYPMDFDRKTLELLPQTVKAPPTVEEISDGPYKGGQRYTYEFYDEAVWDDGRPVTGHDVEFSLKTIFNPNLPTQGFANFLELIREVQVDAQNPKKFSILTDRHYLLADAAIGNITILPAHIYDPEGLTKDISFKEMRDANPDKLAGNKKLKKFAEAFASPKYGREVVSGSGPYKLTDWIDQQRIVFTKKENWWGDKLAAQNPMLHAYPDTIVMIPIKDQTAAMTALKGEQVDVLTEVDSKLFVDERDKGFLNKTYDFQTPPRPAFFYIAMQNRNPKLADKRVRNALARIIDVDEIIRDLYNGLGTRTVGPFPPTQKYYHKGLEPIKMDLAKAKELLAEAGWTDTNNNGTVDKNINGKLTEMELEFFYTPGLTFGENLTELFKNNAKKVGINIKRTKVESNVLRTKLRNGDYELAPWGAGLPAGIPDDPKPMFHTGGANPNGGNYTRFGNAQSDALIEAIRNEMDEAKRNDLYRQFQEIIYEEQPMIFLFVALNRVIVHKRFDAVYTMMTPGVDLQHLKLK